MPKRVVLAANQQRPDILDLLGDFRYWLKERATIVAEYDVRSDEPVNSIEADMVIVLGGDGSILSQSRRFVDTGIPILGVNLGRLGFLADFNLSQFKQQADTLFGEDGFTTRQCIMIEAKVYRKTNGELSEEPIYSQLSLNEFVITSGPPFRMIGLELDLDGQATPELQGDGLIVCTPSGSTAYSVSAGGPILSPDLDCIAITPVAAHSLAFRPIVVSPHCKIAITVLEANPGTTLVTDGQSFEPLQVGDRVVIRKYHKRASLVVNPVGNYWRTLISKMHWGVKPRNY